MRKLIVTIFSTLDGYAAGEGGDVFTMPIDLGFDHYNLRRMHTAGILLFGATTFRAAREYWPRPADDPHAPDVERQISWLYRSLEKVVISDTLAQEDTAPWMTTTEVVPRAAALHRIAALKTGSGGDILCFGSMTTWNPLLALGLVDELHVLIGPGVIGAGLPTFTQAVRGSLTVLDVERLDDSNLVALRYGPSTA